MDATLPTGTITFLFTDIEGSTRLSRRVGEARYAELLDAHRRIVRSAISNHGGHEFGTEGDAIFVAFNTGSEAVAAAVAAQRDLEAHPWPDDAPVRVRMGLHAGEATAREDGNYVGIALHRAARICAAAHGGQILLSEATRSVLREALPAGMRLVDLGPHVLKDFDDPERLYQLDAPDRPAEFPPLRTRQATANHLPRQLTTFVGREAVVAEAAALLRRAPLLTLTGPGGTGKTRLGLRIAEGLVDDFPDGVYFVALASVANPEFVPSAIAYALGLPETPGRTPLDVAIEFVRSKRLLLVLDNFERVVAAAPAVSELLQAAPDLRAIATSRAALHVAGEQEYAVPPLELPASGDLPAVEALARFESVALFVDRARAVRHDFELLDENARAVVEICRRLDGLPLAIELAAARIRLLPPAAIESKLGSRLDLLAGSSRDLPERQRTLRAAIAWSHDLLDEGARGLFARLSVFVGGWTLEAAEEICGSGHRFDVLEGLTELVDQSLVRQEERDGEARFAMLETIREFATEQLSAGGEEEAVRERHARYLLALAERAAPLLTGGDRAHWLDLLEIEHDNLRAAMDRALERQSTEVAFRLLVALWRFWQSRDHVVEGCSRAEAILAMSGDVAPGLRARALAAAGGIAWWAADHERVAALYRASLEIARTLDDDALLAEALYNMTFPLSVAGGDHREELALAEEALPIYVRLGDKTGQAKAYWAIASSRFYSLEFAESIEPFRKALELATSAGDSFMRAWSLHMIGSAEIRIGALEEAAGHLREALELMREAGELTGIVGALDDFSDLAATAGDFRRSALLRGAARNLEDATAAHLAGTWTALFVDRAIPASPQPAEEERLLAEGRALSLDDAIELAVGTAQLLTTSRAPTDSRTAD